MKIINFLLLITGSLFMIYSCTSGNESNTGNEVTSVSPDSETLIKRGEYLVKIIGCDHCHTPKMMTDQGPVPDLNRWLMGYPADEPLPEIAKEALGPGKWVLFNNDLTAAVGPWGVSFSANLTPSESGIGNWSFENFKKSMAEGKHKGLDGGRMVLPPMPWQSFGLINNEDLEAIYAYLQSIKPIDNVVPPPIAPTEI